jgi:hypothetical protein
MNYISMNRSCTCYVRDTCACYTQRLPLRLHALGAGEGEKEWRHDCAVSSDGGSVKLATGVSKEEGKRKEGPFDTAIRGSYP